MRSGIKVKQGDAIRCETIKNLLMAQKRLAESGSAIDNIRMAKYLFKISEKVDGKIQQFCFEEQESCTNEPPNR